MAGELKEKVTRGVAWSIGEKVGTMLLQMGVSIVVLRLLVPDDFGVVAILTAFAAFALVVVDSGFSQTLIRKAEPSPSDYKSVFLFNVSVSAALYVLLTALAPVVARYYDMPVIARVAPVFFLMIPVNALCVIQNTVFIRRFRFALLSKIAFVSSLVSGLAAVLLAWAGCGVWSLVAQRVLQMVVKAVLLWRTSDWRPASSGAWSPAAIREMAPYSFSLLATDLISSVYTKIPQLFIGKLYSSRMLGYFDQALKLKDLPVTSAMTAVQGVTFPALSKIGTDERKFAESYRQVVMVVAYVMFPAMLGLSAVAHDLFAVLIGAKWMPTVPYFETICLAGLFYPVAMVAYNIMKVRCSGPTIVRLEILKKAVMTVILVLTIPRSVQAVVWGLVVFAACEMIVNVWASLRVTSLSVWRFVRTLLPVALVSGAMYFVVLGVAQLMPDHALLRLVCMIAAGAVSYLLFSFIFRLEAFTEVSSIVRKQLFR
ncbi:lipopolysaccharide biosynthesis protein [uncultured Alistipes sp.]|uniref:lipopolysaccharide biosynthesis protein n=1 Tax=uncultured Alistipes sp. TaxID=538949 RepID=UPI00272AF407|nr:lipopolysaccharide biosynthesis protein [uncultured Alistipes sp.]